MVSIIIGGWILSSIVVGYLVLFAPICEDCE